MQVEFWQSPPYAPLGMYVQPTAFHNYLTDSATAGRSSMG